MEELHYLVTSERAACGAIRGYLDFSYFLHYSFTFNDKTVKPEIPRCQKCDNYLVLQTLAGMTL